MAIKVVNITSNQELSKIQKMKLKRMAGFKELNKMVGETFHVSTMATLECHMDADEKHDEKDYLRYVFMDREDNFFVTSSESLKDDIEAYLEILYEDGEGGQLECKLLESPSVNNAGAFFRAELLEIEP